MKLHRVMIAAAKSGSGKTTVTCALLQLLKNMGHHVVSYKCGPDYIDPMFHQKAIDIPSKNLDTFFTGEEETRKLFLMDRGEEDFAVLEGVMGLFDGLGGIREEGSSYHLAKVTKTPILLVVDAKGMGRSVIPLIAGFLNYDKEHLIKGVILNRMSKSYYEILKPLIEEELSITVVGYFPEQKQFRIESRHLGLMLPQELVDVKKHLQEISGELQKTVSVEHILKIAGEAPELEACEVKNLESANLVSKNSVSENSTAVDSESKTSASENSVSKSSVSEDTASENSYLWDAQECPIIAVARDEAFCFYYEDNLRLLQEYGAKLKFFSPIHDEGLPEGSCGILLGGGYPELHGEVLSSNRKMLSSIKEAMESGIPVVAECGGFMYLHNKIIDKENQSYPMVGVINAECHYTGKLVRFGYIELQEKDANFLPEGERIRGHEFHYFDSQQNGENCVATKPVTGRNYPCVISKENCWMGFPHLYYPSNPAFAERFVERAKNYKLKTIRR